MDGMPICDGCGAVVHPQFLQIHQEWHDNLVVVKPLAEDQGPVANPNRTKWGEFFVQDC